MEIKDNRGKRPRLQSAMQTRIGILIIALGIVLIAVGILAYFGALSWFGNLPGDINIERGSTRIYIPLVSMLLVSVLLSLISYAARRFF